MQALIKQFSSLIGAGVAAACCLGISAVLAAVGAVGLGFLVHDAYLFPIFVGFAGFSLWLLYRSAQLHGAMAPFWLGLAGGVFAAAGLWLLVTGVFPLVWSVYTGLGVLVAGSIWDFINGRSASISATEEVCETPQMKAPMNPARRAVNGAALSVVAAGLFYGMVKSVEVFVPKAEGGNIACWGINSCRGTTACSTAYNACSGQNSCKGKGWLYVSAGECRAQGGVPLKGSEADPARD